MAELSKPINRPGSHTVDLSNFERRLTIVETRQADNDKVFGVYSSLVSSTLTYFGIVVPLILGVLGYISFRNLRKTLKKSVDDQIALSKEQDRTNLANLTAKFEEFTNDLSAHATSQEWAAGRKHFDEKRFSPALATMIRSFYIALDLRYKEQREWLANNVAIYIRDLEKIPSDSEVKLDVTWILRELEPIESKQTSHNYPLVKQAVIRTKDFLEKRKPSNSTKSPS